MRLPSKLLLLSFLPAALPAAEVWPLILSSMGTMLGTREVIVSKIDAVFDPTLKSKVETGALLILEGNSAAAASFGFHPDGALLTISSLVDTNLPSLSIVLAKPLSVQRFAVPDEAQVFTWDRWSKAPVVAGFRLGKGAILWLIASPGDEGYERFPYLPQALVSLGLSPSVRARRTWAFFDYAYRARADIDYLAAKWRKSGISALHVAAWHFYESDPGRDAYLNHLMEACHREGILLYAWLELPHVSERFWDEHPQWREKTAALQDAALDWRRLMNLENPDCVRTVQAGISDLIRRFDWDGVNLAELYFESLEGAGNPSRFTPMNDDVRSKFRAEHGFDPADLWTTRRDPDSLRLFLDFRTALARRMQEDWLTQIEKSRSVRPDLDIVLTHVDDRLDRGMTDAIGADSARVLSLLPTHQFTFLVEDPATTWNLGPRRYADIAARYPASSKLAIDVNVVDRYQDVYPTKQQTGVELLELVHMAAQSFPRVALYFENSILSPDLPLLSSASAVVTELEVSDSKLLVSSPNGFIAGWSGEALVDGIPWAALTGEEILLPAGKHTVERSQLGAGPKLLAFNGDLISATGAGKTIAISYASSSRALATLSCQWELLLSTENLQLPSR